MSRTSIHWVILLLLVNGCNTSVKPAGNSETYGGTDQAKLSLFQAQTDLKSSLTRLKNNEDTDALCRNTCASGLDPQVCATITGATPQQRTEVKTLILSTLTDAIAEVNRDPNSLLVVSDTSLAVNGNQVTAMTPFGTEGTISFYRADVLADSAALLRAVFGHEIYHKVMSQYGIFIKDYEPLPPHFPAANGSWQAVTLAGACLSAYNDSHRTHPDNTYQTVILRDSPYGYWRMNEAAGSTDILDYSGHGNFGVYEGDVTLAVAGPLTGNPDTAVQFTSVVGSGSAVPLRNDAKLTLKSASFFQASVGVTVEMWLKWGGRAGFSGMPMSFWPYLNVWLSAAPATAPVKLGFNTGDGDCFCFNVNDFVSSSGTRGLADQWVHMAVFFSNLGIPNNTVYINGQQMPLTQNGVFNNPSGIVANALSHASDSQGHPIIYLGGWGQDTYQTLNGAISQAAIYGTSLTGEQIRRHYQAGLGNFSAD